MKFLYIHIKARNENKAVIRYFLHKNLITFLISISSTTYYEVLLLSLSSLATVQLIY